MPRRDVTSRSGLATIRSWASHSGARRDEPGPGGGHPVAVVLGGEEHHLVSVVDQAAGDGQQRRYVTLGRRGAEQEPPGGHGATTTPLHGRQRAGVPQARVPSRARSVARMIEPRDALRSPRWRVRHVEGDDGSGAPAEDPGALGCGRVSGSVPTARSSLCRRAGRWPAG